VHVVDADPGRVAEAATRNADRHVSFAPLGPGGLPVRDGAFDVAIVEDLASLPDPAHVLRQVRRALGARGTALVASRNPDATVHLLPLSEAGSAPDYYALYDLVTGVFDQVRMIGQAPFAATRSSIRAEAELERLDAGSCREGRRSRSGSSPRGARPDPARVAHDRAAHGPRGLGAGGTARSSGSTRAARAAEAPGARAARRRGGRAGAPRRRGLGASRRAHCAARGGAPARHGLGAQLEGRAATADARADAVQAELEPREERAAAVARELAAVTEELAAERRRQRPPRGALRDGGELARARSSSRGCALAPRTSSAASGLFGTGARSPNSGPGRGADACASRGGSPPGSWPHRAQAARDVASLEEQLAERGGRSGARARCREAARAGAELVAELARLREGRRSTRSRQLSPICRRNADLWHSSRLRRGHLAAQRAAPPPGARLRADPRVRSSERPPRRGGAGSRAGGPARQLRAQATSPQAGGGTRWIRAKSVDRGGASLSLAPDPFALAARMSQKRDYYESWGRRDADEEEIRRPGARRFRHHRIETRGSDGPSAHQEATRRSRCF
jgi:hypothetical protein